MLDTLPDCDELPEGVVTYYDEVPDLTVYSEESNHAFYSELSASTDLYYYDEPSETFKYISEPSQYINTYYTWNEETSSYHVVSEPSPYKFEETSPYVETYYYDTPSVDLYFYSAKTDSYYYVDEPSPFISEYYTWNQATQSYDKYESSESYDSWETTESEEFSGPTAYYNTDDNSYYVWEEPSASI